MVYGVALLAILIVAILVIIIRPCHRSSFNLWAIIIENVMGIKAADVVRSLAEPLNQVLIGKEPQIKLALACLLARGHLLIEDLPGMGKTSLSQGLAKVLGLDHQRIQFTSDLLPSDVLGVSIFNTQTQQFEFRQGPIFTQVLLADEINRTSPKTQSALLEAMAERQVTVDGTTHKIDGQFFVIATQNSQQQSGTFPLPESQLDRFMMRITLGYPDAVAERQLLEGHNPQIILQKLQAAIDTPTLHVAQQTVTKISCSGALLDYLQRLIAHTRESGDFEHGLSPRAALAWLQGAKAWALVNGRGHVVPEDLQYLLAPVAGHRLLPTESMGVAQLAMQDILRAVPVIA